jgi:GT2 family glycosyltransferase
MIDVVIVTYNRKDTLFQNLHRLNGCRLINQVIVVDNASTDDTVHEGIIRFPSVQWIPSTINEGCIAWNRGMAFAKQRWALILDDDCFVDEESLRQAAEFAGCTPCVGLVAFNILSVKTGKSEWGVLARGNAAVKDWPNAIGACMLVDANVFRLVGGYKDFFLCFNDLELALSIWRSGNRVVFHPSWIAHHLGLRPHPSKRRIEHEVRNLMWTAWSHLSIPFSSALTVKFIAAALTDSIRYQNPRKTLQAAKVGIQRGWEMRKSRRGRIPGHVLKTLAKNFLLGSRIKARADLRGRKLLRY